MDARHLAPHAATDVHQTGSRGGAEARRWGAQRSGRLTRHGRPGQGSTYL